MDLVCDKILLGSLDYVIVLPPLTRKLAVVGSHWTASFFVSDAFPPLPCNKTPHPGSKESKKPSKIV